VTAARHACTFCIALQRLALRRRDALLTSAAIRLRAEHAANDVERMVFARERTAGARHNESPVDDA
jgi:hypothetical protein